MLDNLKDSDLFGRYYFKCVGQRLTGYYESIDYLNNYLLIEDGWVKNTTGFYINQSGDSLLNPEIRLSYYVPEDNVKKLNSFVNRVTKRKDFELALLKDETEKPREDRISPMYGSDWMNLMFRKFLCHTTLMFLDIMNTYDITKLAKKLIKVRYCQNKSCYKYLKKLFKKSIVYNSMKIEEREEYVKLCDFHDWRHFWVNLGLGYDMEPIDRAIFNKQSYFKRQEMIDDLRVYL